MKSLFFLHCLISCRVVRLCCALVVDFHASIFTGPSRKKAEEGGRKGQSSRACEKPQLTDAGDKLESARKLDIAACDLHMWSVATFRVTMSYFASSFQVFLAVANALGCVAVFECILIRVVPVENFLQHLAYDKFTLLK